MNSLFSTYLSGLRLGEPQRWENLVVVPILLDQSASPEYLTLTEALAQNLAVITEVGGGTVSQVKVANTSDRWLLMVDGEELLGARQNRTLNASILVRPQSELVVPVSCTERGRWHHTSPAFQDAGFVSPHSLRKAKSDSVGESLARHAQFAADQGKVWGQVSFLCESVESSSPTQAMADAMHKMSTDLDHCIQALRPVDEQKGLVVLINGEIAGMDLVSSSRAYQVLHPKLIRSYALEALTNPRDGETANPNEKIRRFLESCRSGVEQVRPSVGAGEDHRRAGQKVAGAALVYESSVLHLNAYRT